jgi:hypothetical protein
VNWVTAVAFGRHGRACPPAAAISCIGLEPLEAMVLTDRVVHSTTRLAVTKPVDCLVSVYSKWTGLHSAQRKSGGLRHNVDGRSS